jgi:hypothetical protein
MNSMLKQFVLASALGLFSLPCPVLAWGPEGHEIVADIAEYYLTPAAKEKVEDILGSKKLDDFEIACWPDLIRGNKEYEAIYPGNGSWHYVDFDAAKHYEEGFELKLPENGQDIVTQIGRWRDELASPETSPERRLDALRFLVHFAGDLHQPLHCAYRYGDMGGNMIPVNSFTGKHYSFGPETPMDYAPSVHSVWDEAMVNELIGNRKPKTVARELRKEITPEQSARWLQDDVLAWAVDSYWRARKQVYRWTDGTSLPWKWARPGMDLTSENYIDSHLPIVSEQLQKGGVRLAHLINSALDPDYVKPAVPESAAAEPAK